LHEVSLQFNDLITALQTDFFLGTLRNIINNARRVDWTRVTTSPVFSRPY